MEQSTKTIEDFAGKNIINEQQKRQILMEQDEAQRQQLLANMLMNKMRNNELTPQQVAEMLTSTDDQQKKEEKMTKEDKKKAFISMMKNHEEDHKVNMRKQEDPSLYANPQMPKTEDLIIQQKAQVESMKQKERESIQSRYTTLSDKISQQNVCYKHESTLKEVTLNEIEFGKVEKNTITWLEVITETVKINAITLIVQDIKGQAVSLMLYNQFQPKTNFDQLQKIFPVGLKIGIKQPYMKVSNHGQVSLRNDNPQNIILKNEKLTVQQLKDQGNVFFKEKFYLLAIEYYNQALLIGTTDTKLKVAIMGNMSQCYLELNSNANALHFAEEALKIDENHIKCYYRKAKALALLSKFETSLEVYEFVKSKGYECDDEIKEMKTLIEQSKKFAFNIQNNSKKVCIMNANNKGRGMFASENITQGDLLIVEKPIAQVTDQQVEGFQFSATNQNVMQDSINVELAKKCIQIAKLGDIQALRLSYLCDGSDKEIPPLELFTQNDYEVQKQPEISYTQIEQIIRFNSWGDGALQNNKMNTSNCLYGLISFINHAKDENVFKSKKGEYTMVTALRNIPKGDEIVFDYIKVYEEEHQRVKALEKWGIKE